MVTVTETQFIVGVAIIGALIGAIAAGLYVARADDVEAPGCAVGGAIGMGASAMLTPCLSYLMALIVNFYDVPQPSAGGAFGYFLMGILVGFLTGAVGGAIGGAIVQAFQPKR